MKLPAANGRVSQLEPRVPDVIAVDVRYFGDKNAKTDKFCENIQSAIVECFYGESIA
jgi:hypothetical protein